MFRVILSIPKSSCRFIQYSEMTETRHNISVRVIANSDV